MNSTEQTFKPEESASPEPTTELQIRKTAFHEAAHAVMFWNLGMGVERVWLDRIHLCGHAQKIRCGKDSKSLVGSAVASFAGLASQSYLEPTMRWRDVVRSFTDFHLGLVDFLPPGKLTDGEQLGVALTLTRRVVSLLKTPEVKRQIYALVSPLIKHGCLLNRQVEVILKALPESAVVRRKSREMVEELIQTRDQIVASARGYAPEFSWNPNMEIP